MASDVRGEPLAVGDKVVMHGIVVKSGEDTEIVTIKSLEPTAKPKMQTTVSLRGECLEKVAE